MRLPLLVLLTALAACGPRYETEVTLTPPESEQGRICIAQCQNTEEICRARVDTEAARCELEAERDADRRRRQCERRVDRKLDICRAGASTASELGACHAKHGLGSTERARCDRRPLNQCRPDYDRCQQRFEGCYIGCGGQVAKRQVCVANCDQ